jgi:predicted permease
MPEWSEHLRPRLALLQLSAAREAEIIEELSQHLDQRYEELRSGGTSDADARRLAIEELLEPDALAKHMRSLRQAHVPSPITPGAPNGFLLGDLWQDLRYAARMLRKQPGFAAAAVLTLALGLGANIAIFSLVYGLLIRSLPVDRPDELYRLGDTNNCCVNSGLQGSYSLFAFRLFEHLREATSDDFVELAAFQAQSPQPMVVRRGGDVAASLPGQYVSANYFQMFGVRPAAGRLLRPDDDRPGAEPVVVISHQAWTQRFGQDPSLVGSSILVYGRPMTVAGVAAQGFFGDTVRPNPAMLWIPLGQEPALRGEASLIDRVNQDWLYAIGRLRSGVEPEQAAMRATNALRQWFESQSFLSEEERVQLPQQHVKVVSAGGGVPVLQTQFGQVLTILFITSGLVLLIATANLANLLLARADRGQAAIRAALGASTGRLLRQSVTEGVLLGLVGGFMAIWLAAAGTRALVGLAFPDAQYVPVDTVTTPAVWLFALGLAVLTGALFSAGPAWFMSRTPPLEALAGVGRSGHVRSFVPRRSLVVAQVALSFVLLCGAGLLASSLGRLEAEELGFEPEGRTIVQINPPPLAGQRERVARIFADTRDRLLRIPGVKDASHALYGPMEGQNWSGGISIAGRAVNPTSPEGSSWNRVGPRYFETVGTRLLRGRTIEEAEITGGARVAVINDAFRRRFFENTEPIGQHLGLGGPAHAGDYEIVGVVEDVRYTAPRDPVRPMIFLPAFQVVEYAEPSAASVQARSMLLRTLIVHASVDPAVLERAIRRAITEIDPDIHVIRVRPLAEQVSLNFRIERLMARLTSTYGLLALLVASIGLYGVTAFTVAQRTREIGVRMALGADRSRIVATVARGPVGQTLVGLAIGVPLAFVASRLISTQLYGVGSEDPLVFGAATVVLLGSAAIAATIPALRAASINPTQALRGD